MLMILLASCTTIPVDESILLQPRQSVTPATFDRLGLEGYTLVEHYFDAADGTDLNGWFFSRPGGTGRAGQDRVTVVFFGGNGFYLVHSIQFLELFESLDVDVFLWDYRGYGLSAGEATLERMKADALVAVDYTVDTLGARGPIVAHGHSIGSFIASYVADERAVDALVLESPATNADHWLQSAVPRFVRRLISIEIAEELTAIDNIPRVARFTGPSLFAVGEEDFVTPPAMAELLYETSEAPWRRLYTEPAGDHNSLPRDPGFRDLYRELIRELQ